MRPIISYLRVSTSQQGRSGLGIEAQRAAMCRFADAEGFEVVAEHVEVETGKGGGRAGPAPQACSCENGGDKLVHGSGGISQLRAE